MHASAVNIDPYGCQDGHALLTNSSWGILCPPVEEVALRSPVVSESLPTLSDATRIGRVHLKCYLAFLLSLLSLLKLLLN